MKSCQISCLAAALLLVAGCNIQFNAPVFPQDTSGGDVIGGDTGIDGVVPDGVEKTCAELDGICADPTQEDLNSQGCPWGYELMPEGTCTGDNHCCTVSPSCEQAGTVFTADADGIGCCPGLDSFDFRTPVAGFQNCGNSEEEYICTDCGDGVCDEWENPCICLEDCPWGGNECKENGGTCMSACPRGHEPLDVGGCEGGDVCCSKEKACLTEGEAAEYAPGSPPCCGTLVPIDVTEWGGGELGCQPNENWYVCSYCGNNNCETWESPCTCGHDCDEIQKNFCEEEGGMCWGSDEPCPEGTTPVFTAGCPDGMQCCMENGAGCVDAGGHIFDEGKFCCEGLEMIEEQFVNEEGQCQDTFEMLCTACGNGACEDGWENECNCPEDCA